MYCRTLSFVQPGLSRGVSTARLIVEMQISNKIILLKGFPFSIVAMNRLHLFSGLKQKNALPFTSLKSI